jgi:hypothetical protein
MFEIMSSIIDHEIFCLLQAHQEESRKIQEVPKEKEAAVTNLKVLIVTLPGAYPGLIQQACIGWLFGLHKCSVQISFRFRLCRLRLRQ